MQNFNILPKIVDFMYNFNNLLRTVPKIRECGFICILGGL